MKAKIHPEYVDCKVSCGCGNHFMTRSTRKEIHVEVCSSCHPFYTGKQKFVDTAGRIEKFNRKYAAKKPAGKAETPAPAPADG
jgi:large subunit ribosomal protein L31